MKKRIEVRNQAEFDACVSVGNIAIVIGCHVVARGSSSVEARENSSVVAWGNVFIRLFSALKIKISAHVVVMRYNNSMTIEGEGRELEAIIDPRTGKEYCEFNGISLDSPFKVDNIDYKIYEAIQNGKGELDMSSWHKEDCDKDNWCGTSHCRAGYAICLAGEEGFKLEKKYDAELAGRMIYAVSRPDEELPDFFADTDEVLEELKEKYNNFQKLNKKEVTLKLTDDQLEEIKKQYNIN